MYCSSGRLRFRRGLALVQQKVLHSKRKPRHHANISCFNIIIVRM